MFHRARDWFAEGCTAWVGAVSLLLLIVVPHLRWGTGEAIWRYQGTAIEFFGLLCVLIGIGRIRSQFGLPSIRRAITDYAVNAVSIFRRRPINASVIVAGIGSSVSVGTVVAYAHTSGTAIERVDQLEKMVGKLRGDLDGYKNQLSGDLNQLSAAQQEEKKAREAGDEAETKKLTETMTGDMQLELVGWFYICFGLFLANLSQELSRWFC